ncbi:MAG: sugar transferase [Pseudomonadota bacterium]
MSFDPTETFEQSESKPSTVLGYPLSRWSWKFRVFKRGCDVFFACLALPLLGAMSIVLLALNPLLNPGRLFFRQERMGLGGKSFWIWKYRTMTDCHSAIRGYHDPVEEDRITPLGRLMRTLRIDELPNFLNVLKGEMSVVGPRPDDIAHAKKYTESIPYYSERTRVKPGITGLAQVRMGYAANEAEVRKKARYDSLYVRRSCGRMDLSVIAATLVVMVTGFGAR